MAVADLTRDEARERAGLLAVDSYEVELDFTRGAEVFGSTSVARFTCARPGASTIVDVIADRIHSATLNGEPVDLSAYADGQLPLAHLAAENVLTVTADFAYTNECIGVHRAVDHADGKVYLYTSFSATEARRAFANFDQPDLKAAFSFTVIAPDHWLVLSNSATPTPAAVREGVARWQFPPTPRLPGYVTAIVAGEYALVQKPFKTKRGQEIPLGLACRASLAEYLDPEDLFEITSQGLDFYTELFDMDFPFAKYDQVFVPEFFAEAMENAGCVTFTENGLFRSKATAMMYEDRANTLLHEMAHMWFGDYVTMRWWGGLWLNESFAEFCGTFVSAQATRFTDAWAMFANQRKTWGYTQDQLPSTHPIVGDAPTINAALDNFDGISYAKGASVLKQLVSHIGQDVFFAGVRAYFAEHAWANAEFHDLLNALERASGKDLREWSAVWLETAGPNTLSTEFEVDDTGRFTSFAVRQQAPAEHPTLRPHHIAIGLYNRHGGTLTRTYRAELDVTGERTEVPALTGRPRPDVILLNDDDLGYALTRFDPQSLDVLAEGIGAFDGPLPRAVAWTAVIDMVQHAEMSVPTFFRVVANGMSGENSVSLLQTLLTVTRNSVLVMADPAWLPTGLTELAAAGIDLLHAAEPGSDLQLAWADLLTWTATSAEQLDLLAGLLDGTVTVPGLDVDTDLRWALLQRLAATGRNATGHNFTGHNSGDQSDADHQTYTNHQSDIDRQIDAELTRDFTDAGIRQAHRARACVPDSAHKAAAWTLLTENEDLGHQGITAVAKGFGLTEHTALLAPYPRRYFEFLPVLWDNRSEQIRMTIAKRLFPYACAGEELTALAAAFLADPGLDPSLRRVIVEAMDLVDRILRSRAL
jgi:aminopeptidase N